MKPPPFSYHDPKTVFEVVGLLSTLENAKLLAGGQSLMPMLNFRFVQPDHIIDLNRVEGLAYIRDTADGLTAIAFAAWPAGHGYACVEFARRHGDFAIVSAAVLLIVHGAGKITRAAVTLGGMGTAPVRATELERALLGQAPDAAFLRE